MHPPLQMSTIWSTRAVAAAWAATAVMLGPFGCGSLIVTQKSVESLEVRRGFTWETHELDGFVIYVEPGSVAPQNRDAIADEGRTAREHVLAYLQEPVYEPTAPGARSRSTLTTDTGRSGTQIPRAGRVAPLL